MVLDHQHVKNVEKIEQINIHIIHINQALIYFLKISNIEHSEIIEKNYERTS